MSPAVRTQETSNVHYSKMCSLRSLSVSSIIYFSSCSEKPRVSSDPRDFCLLPPDPGIIFLLTYPKRRPSPLQNIPTPHTPTHTHTHTHTHTYTRPLDI